jgi:hypothetical protein
MMVENYFPQDTRVKNEANLLTDVGYDVSVIALRNKGQIASELVNRVQVYRVPQLELFKKTSPVNLSRAGRLFLKLRSSFGYLVEYCYFTAACLILSSYLFVRRGFDVIPLSEAVAEQPGRRHPAARIVERTSWSCHHGVARWSAECPDAVDGRWKGPLRAALERLAAAIDAATERWFASLDGGPDVWALREGYVDVVVGAVTADAFASEHLASPAPADRARALALLEAQRWRLAMFASDGWYWDDPIRPETRQILRSAARAVRIVDAEIGTALEKRLVDDLALFTSPSRGLDGGAIYRTALAEVGQPA